MIMFVPLAVRIVQCDPEHHAEKRSADGMVGPELTTRVVVIWGM